VAHSVNPHTHTHLHLTSSDGPSHTEPVYPPQKDAVACQLKAESCYCCFFHHVPKSWLADLTGQSVFGRDHGSCEGSSFVAWRSGLKRSCTLQTGLCWCGAVRRVVLVRGFEHQNYLELPVIITCLDFSHPAHFKGETWRDRSEARSPSLAQGQKVPQISGSPIATKRHDTRVCRPAPAFASYHGVLSGSCACAL